VVGLAVFPFAIRPTNTPAAPRQGCYVLAGRLCLEGKMSDADRFWSKVEKTDGCWLWTAFKNPKGYGQLTYHQRRYLAHRFAWKITFGPVPVGAEVLHHCDNPACVRPDHLFIGCHADNMHDMVQKERSARGERHSQSKLTENDVRQIRSEHAIGATYRSLAEKYGVKPNAIGSVVTFDHWKHVR
jgi:hypothetical protein